MRFTSTRSSPVPHILKERVRQDRRSKFDVEDEEKEDAKNTAPDAHLQKLSGVRHDGRREQERRGHGYEALAQATSSRMGQLESSLSCSNSARRTKRARLYRTGRQQ